MQIHLRVIAFVYVERKQISSSKGYFGGKRVAAGAL